MSYMFNVEVEGKANAVFDTADEAVRYAMHHVYLQAHEFQSAVDTLNRGHVFMYSYGFAGVNIVPVAKRKAEVPGLAMYQSVLADNKSLRQQLAAAQQRIAELESDPAVHFAHRFAVVLECIIHSEFPNEFWSEATLLLSEYHEAQGKWREAMGEPYVSGFGKD